LGGKNFSAGVPGSIARTGFYAGSSSPSVKGVLEGCFFGFWCDRPEIFGPHELSRQKKSNGSGFQARKAPGSLLKKSRHDLMQ